VALQGLFDHVLQIAVQAGTMKLGRVVLDGSKVKANLSKHRASFRQFLLRGLKKVQGEWAIICLTHNILKLHRLCYG